MKLEAAILLLIISSCADSTSTQREYVSMRNNCREIAELKLGVYISPQKKNINVKDKNAMLASMFSDCMFTQGWVVAAPPTRKNPVDDDILPEDKPILEMSKRDMSDMIKTLKKPAYNRSQILPANGVGVGPSVGPGRNLDFNTITTYEQ